MVKSPPKLFANVDSSELYIGNGIGKVSIEFVNNGLSDIKFLTVELGDSVDYDIVESNKKYIGDLDSDDFESIDYRLKLTSEKREILLPLHITYKDSLNNDYSETLELELKIRTAEELGRESSNTLTIVVVLIVIIIIVYIIYRKYKKKKRKRK